MLTASIHKKHILSLILWRNPPSGTCTNRCQPYYLIS